MRPLRWPGALWPADFSERASQAELMDLPEADRAKLEATVDQFTLINRLLTRSFGLIRRYIIDDALRRGLTTITVADLGAGGGDLALSILRAGESRGLSPRLICLDHDPRVVGFAKERLAGIEQIEVHCAEAREIGRFGEVDYIFANHFLHHLPTVEIPGLLSTLAESARYAVLLNDLRRSRLSYAAYTLFAALFLRGSFAFYDGRLSIRKGFLPQELEELAAEAGFKAEVRTLFPGRVVLLHTRE